MERVTGEPRTTSRAGYSLIELVVVLMFLFLLSGVIFPAIGNARVISRRLGCANNLKDLALAATGFAAAKNGVLPDISSAPPGLCDTKLAAPNDIPSAVSFHFNILPYLDQAAAIEYIEQQPDAKSANLGLKTVLKSKFKILTCPEDSNHAGRPGGISYVANCGYGEFTAQKGAVKSTGPGIHSARNYNAWDQDAKNGVSEQDRTIARATGMFWVPDEDGWKNSLDRVVNGDGAGQTIMFSENLNAGTLALAGTDPVHSGFLVGRTSIAFDSEKQPLAFSDVPKPFEFRINSNLGKLIGKSPMPSSMHKGGVNAAFCDGHIAFLAEDLDPAVYVRLMSPAGIRYGQEPHDADANY